MQDVGIGLDTPICQYMDLNYLMTLLTNKKYYITKKKFFVDKLGKRIPLRLRFLPIPCGQVGKTRDQERSQAERTAAICHYEQNAANLLTSCWTERITENALMWDRGGEKHKVCIKSTIGNFISAISTSDYVIWCGKIIYEPIYPVLQSEDIIWYKEPYFSDEREIRFYFSTDYNNVTAGNAGVYNIQLQVQPETLIQEIILSPYIDKKTSTEIKKCIQERYHISTSSSAIEVN